MKVFAHRGFSGKYPENTMLSFEKALEAGADGIELDIHLSKDNEVMVIHDESLERTTGRVGLVGDFTRAELENINAGRTMEDAFGMTAIPSLEEYLAFISNHRDKVTNIEIKTAPIYYPKIEEKALELVERFALEENIIWSSFNWLSIVKMKMLAPEMEAGLLSGATRLYNIDRIISELDIEYFHPHFSLLDDDIVSAFQKSGVGLNVWTVNEESELKQCIEWNVDGIITNYPDMALNAVNSI